MKNNEMMKKYAEVVADPTSSRDSRAVADFYLNADGLTSTADLIAVAEAVNKKYHAEAVASMWSGNNFDWTSMVNGVTYPVIDPEAAENILKHKLLTVRDCFCLRKTKNSTKAVLPGTLFGMVAQMGLNMGQAFDSDHAEAVAMLKVYTKFTSAPAVFFEETATSNNSLERQLQVIADSLLGADAVKIKKAYAVHAKDCFIRATREGYKNGNEIALLQVLVEHIRDCKNGVKYVHKSGLEGHRDPEAKKKNGKK